MTDARVVRTRAALQKAATALAAKKSASAISVSELTGLAGVNRATFYKHYDTPSDAVAAALGSELDEVRESYASGDDGQEEPLRAFTRSLHELLDRVERHRTIYATAFESPHDGVALNLLADHITGSLRIYLAHRAEAAQPQPHVDLEIVAHSFGYGGAGAVKAWLLQADKTRESFVQSMVAALPD